VDIISLLLNCPVSSGKLMDSDGPLFQFQVLDRAYSSQCHVYDVPVAHHFGMKPEITKNI